VLKAPEVERGNPLFCVIQAPELEHGIMRYELSDHEWDVINPMLPNKPRGVHALNHSASSGHGTIVDFTVFIAIASATARPMPSSENG
jgi:hypothetical protein